METRNLKLRDKRQSLPLFEGVEQPSEGFNNTPSVSDSLRFPAQQSWFLQLFHGTLVAKVTV